MSTLGRVSTLSDSTSSPWKAHSLCSSSHTNTAIGSGSAYALAAARALSEVEGLDAMTIGV